MNKFTFGDTVRVKADAPNARRRSQRGFVNMVFHPQDRVGSYFDRFPPGILYSIEYEDAEMEVIHEDFLEKENI